MNPFASAGKEGRGAPRALDLFRVGSIQIGVDPSWLVIFVLVLWSLSAGYFPQQYPGQGWGTYLLVGFISTLFFFASVLVHELSHAVVGNRLGEEVKRITLFLFGGMAHLSGEPRSPGAEFKIAVVGPLTSVALGVFFLLVARAAAAFPLGALWIAMFRYLGFINIALAVFNLLPGYPLDGGRLLRAFFWSRGGDLQAATARAADWSGGIAIGLMVLGALQIFGGGLIGGLWLIFIAMFLRGAARAGYYSVVVEHALGAARVRDLMVEDPVTVGSEMSLAAAVDEAFLRHGMSGFPVVDNGVVRGLISLSDVRRFPASEREQRRVGEVMRGLEDAICISPDASIAEALRKMTEADCGRLLVISDGTLRGFLTRSGIARFIQLRMALGARDD
jgi:Zn-dependent protease/CBS domain-containing protein